MAFNYSNINIRGQQQNPVNPIEIFQGSAVNDDRINDLWLAQGDALREWHDSRDKSDVAVVLNTGAGKTLVGLLMAQSLVNETRRQVVYACGSIQLVEQTAEKAIGYGLPVTTYYYGNFSPDGRYQRAEAPCVTTYQALFNDRTRFRSDDLAAAIFDDAHTAEHILRGQFSVSISRNSMATAHQQIVDLFRPYHDSVGLTTSYMEMINRDTQRQFFVPPFEIRRNANELRSALRNANLDVYDSTKFAWEHIRDHEDLCCLLISDTDVTLTPPVIPFAGLPYFDPGVRRVYLSATLNAPDSFVRAFGRTPQKIVAPTTTAGECERMILIPSAASGVNDDVASAKEIIQNQKALILVPSFNRGEKWADVSPNPPRELVPQAVHSFRQAKQPEKLTLAARYDGIDLPGDTCRMMVLDDLPAGSGPLERFQWERLNMQNSLRSLLASRIVQSFGRISRGMSDHGVVLITGQSLIEWLQLPRNRDLLPKFLQKQLEIGEAVSQGAASNEELIVAATDCLSRNPNWIHFYTNEIRQLSSQTVSPFQDHSLKVAVAEAKFGKALWDRDFSTAASVLNAILEEAIKFSQHTGAWLSLWLGFAFEMDGDVPAASYFYRKAHALQSNIPRPRSGLAATPTHVPPQIVRAAEQMPMGYGDSLSIQIPKTMIADLAALDGSGSVSQIEEALRCLGQYLGLNSTRPDNDPGTGPDVLWIDEGGLAVCMEVKACKQPTSIYRKEDVGQLYDHVQWVKDNCRVSDIFPVFVGPSVPTSPEANPSPDMQVINLENFDAVAKRLISALQDVASSAIPLSLQTDLHTAMRERRLLYPDVFHAMGMERLIDVKQN